MILVTADFLNSDFATRELDAALEHQKRGKATVVAVIVRQCHWDGMELGQFQVLCADRPVFKYGREPADRDEAWLTVVREVEAIALRPPKAGDTKVNPKDGMEYVWIPPGKFMMGASPGDTEAFEDEKPAREVTISKGFWLGKTPITVDAWNRVYGKAPSWNAKWTIAGKERDYNPGRADGAMPVIGLTWDEVCDYCSRTGGRLPTEAEYEYAARAGSKGPRYGDLDSIAWYGDNSGKSRLDTSKMVPTDGNWDPYRAVLRDNGNGPHHVGTKLPNDWGLYDMLGNVWSWTADWWDAEYYKKGEALDPKGPATGTQRVLRGGSWSDFPLSLRASVRGNDGSAQRGNYFGARCVGE